GLQSCDKNDHHTNDAEISIPELGTVAPTDITKSSARAGGIIYTYGNSIVSKSGIIWGREVELNVQSNIGKTENGSRVGSFYSLMRDLEPGEKYYVRSYATNTAGTAYG